MIEPARHPVSKKNELDARSKITVVTIGESPQEDPCARLFARRAPHFSFGALYSTEQEIARVEEPDVSVRAARLSHSPEVPAENDLKKRNFNGTSLESWVGWLRFGMRNTNKRRTRRSPSHEKILYRPLAHVESHLI